MPTQFSQTPFSGQVRFGAVVPQTEIGNDRQEIGRYAAGVQNLGFRHLLAYDHVLSGSQQAHHPKLVGRYDEHSPFHEVFVLFGYLAAIAPDLEMVTGVLILPQRQTALVAKQAATLDVFTAGKTRIGVGIGWNDIEYQGLGESFGNRAKRLEEQIDVLRTLWTDSIVSLRAESGTRSTTQGLAPMPIQQPIPVWIGGSADVGRAPRGTNRRWVLPELGQPGSLRTPDRDHPRRTATNRSRSRHTRHRAAHIGWRDIAGRLEAKLRLVAETGYFSSHDQYDERRFHLGRPAS